MAASILDGTAVAKEVYSRLGQRVQSLVSRGVRPGLAAVQVGEHPASAIYVRRKVRACAEVGVYSEVHQLDANAPEATLLDAIAKLNRNSAIHGILLQLPLPTHFDAGRIMQAISVAKDVDGFTWKNLGAMVAGRPLFTPCTPTGIIELLDRYDIPIEGRIAVVIGRSTEVGKPMALMLVSRSATVSVCHSKTCDLRQHTAMADILVVAAGRPGLVKGDMIKPGAVVIDVGINRMPDGRVRGDVDFADAAEIAGYITPVPGGVGPMTVAMVIANTVAAAENQTSETGA